MSAMDRLFEDVWNRGRLEVIDEIVTPDVALHSGDAVSVGRAGLREVVATWRTAFPDIHHRIDDRFTRHDGAEAARWHGEGTHLAPFMDIPPTGRRFSYWGMTIAWTDGDGVMTELWAAATVAEMIAALKA
jgi:predicted ester cyclase